MSQLNTTSSAEAASQPLAMRAYPVPPRALETLCAAGLAGVYLVNSIVAILQPEDFRGLLDHSLLARGLHMTELPGATVLIALNDLALGCALVATIFVRRFLLPALAWSGVWLLLVALIKLFALDVFVG